MANSFHGSAVKKNLLKMKHMGLTRNIRILSLYSFLSGVGSSTFFTLFPLYLVSLGYGMSRIGEITTLSSLSVAVPISFLGLFADYYGRKPFIILAGLSLAVSLFVTASTRFYIWFIIAYALNMLSFFGGQSARGAMVAESVSKEKMGEAFGIVVSWFFLARVSIPSVSGVLASLVGYRLTFIFAGVTVLAGTLLFWVGSIETSARKGEKISWGEIASVLKPRKKLTWLYISTVLDRFGWALWSPLLNAFMSQAYGLSTVEVGFLNSIMGFTTLVTQYITGKWIDKIGYIKGLILSEFAGLSSALFLGVLKSVYSLILGVIMVGLSISLWIPSYNKAVSMNSKKEYRVLEYSKINTYRAVAAIPSPYIGGYMYDYLNPTTPFLTSSMLLFLAMMMFYRASAQDIEN